MPDKPLFISLCEAFVDNLGLILRVALVLGGIAFVQELRDVRDIFSPAADESESARPVAEELQRPPNATEDAGEPWLTDGVKQALRCTHAEYRDRHYDECVQEPSDVYRKPDATTDDDIGFLAREDLVLYARLAPTPD